MAYPAKKHGDICTYAEYLTWPEDVRCEIIDGVIYNMTPGPSMAHQSIQGSIFGQLYTLLKSFKCKVYGPPTDVALGPPNAPDEMIKDVLQPDVFVVCNKDQIHKQACFGPPEFIVEITSPATKERDRTYKTNRYEKFGVKEYWIVDPDEKTVAIRRLTDDGLYDPVEVCDAKGMIPIKALSNIKIDFDAVFAEIW